MRAEGRRGAWARRTANGGAAVDRARRRWRFGAMAVVAGVAAVCLARSGAAALCLFAAGVLAGRLIEGLRHAPRPVKCFWRRRRT